MVVVSDRLYIKSILTIGTNMFDGRPAAHEKVPYETIPRNVRIGARCFGGVLTVSRWTWKQCTRCGMGVGSTGRRPHPRCRLEGESYPDISTQEPRVDECNVPRDIEGSFQINN